METKRHYQIRIAQLRDEATRETRQAAAKELRRMADALEAKMRRLFPEAA